MQTQQLGAQTQLNTAVSANDTNVHRPSRKERREHDGKKQQWEHGKLVAAVSATITPAEVPLKNGLIKLHGGQEFVLIFECPRKEIPKGVQILPLTCGKAESSKQNDVKKPDVRISTAKVDLNGLLERVSVDSISVTDRAGYITVFVNCTVGRTKNPGFNHWGGGVYEAFVKRALSQTWNRAIIRDESANRTTLTLRKGVSRPHEAKIRFAIE